MDVYYSVLRKAGESVALARHNLISAPCVTKCLMILRAYSITMDWPLGALLWGVAEMQAMVVL